MSRCGLTLLLLAGLAVRGWPAAAATREEILSLAVRVADRLATVRTCGQSWQDAPCLVGTLLVAEQLRADGAPAAAPLWERVDRATTGAPDPIVHGDQTAWAQAALDMVRLAGPEQAELRAAKLALTDAALAFAERALHYRADDGPPLEGWWVAAGYGCRYWQDDLFTVLPWLAMRGSGSAGMPADPLARDLAWEWLEAHAFDHRLALEGAPDRDVPALPVRRTAGWERGDPVTGRLLLDPATCLWWHDPDRVGGGELWGRGNGWVAAGLARAEGFLDTPYAGGRYERWLDWAAVRSLLAHMAITLAERRDTFGAWGSELAGSAPSGEPEASATALITYALARGVNQGFLDRNRFTPVVLKSFHLLTRLLDADGDLHRIQPTAAGPGTGLGASDDPQVNLDYGVGALLMASSEIARLPAADLASLETTEAVVVPRARFAHLDGRLVIPLAELGAAARGVADATSLGAISGQQVLAAGCAGAYGLVWVEDGGEGEVALFWTPPETIRLALRTAEEEQ